MFQRYFVEAGFSCQNRYSALRVISAVLIVIASLLVAGCQDQRAKITITVIDEITKAPIANSSITFKGQTLSLKEDGVFVIKGVEKGSYTIRVAAPGYEETKVTIEVDSGQSIHVPIQLSPLATSTEIGSESATLIGPKGATLFIAPNTYGNRERTTIQVKLVPEGSASYSLEGLISPIYEIRSDTGEYLRQPATLTIPLNDNVRIDSGSYVLAVYWNGVRWTPLGGKLNTDNRSVQVKIAYFGRFAVKRFPSLPESKTTEHFHIIALGAPSYSLGALAENLERVWSLITHDLGFVISPEDGEPITAWVLEQENVPSNETKTLDDLYQYLNHSITFSTDIDRSFLNVQTAYELSHLLLGSYVRPQNREDLYRILWWMEATASWISAKALESREYDLYRQLYQRQDGQVLQSSLASIGNTVNPIAVTFVRYIEEKFGTGTVRSIWERLTSDLSVLEVTDSVLQDRGSSLAEVYLDLVSEHAYPNSEWMRKVISSSGQGEALYPEVRVTLNRGLKEFDLPPFSSGILQLVPKDGVQGTLVLNFEPVEASQEVKVRILLKDVSGRVSTKDLVRLDEFRIPNFGQEVLKASLLVANTSADEAYLNLTYQMREESPEEEPLEELLPPVAVIKVSETRGVAPLVVEFDASESRDPAGEILEYLWDFGDGETASGVRVTHTYERPGKYTVFLTVMDSSGLKQQASVEIEVLAAPENVPVIIPEVEYSEKFDFEIFTQEGERMLLSEYLDRFHKGKYVLLAVGDIGEQAPVEDIREVLKGIVEPLDIIRVHYLENMQTMEEVQSDILDAQLSPHVESIFAAFGGPLSELIGITYSSQGFGRIISIWSSEEETGLLLISIDRRILHVFDPYEILDRDKLLQEWNLIKSMQESFPTLDILSLSTEFYFLLYSDWYLISKEAYASLSIVDFLLRYNHPIFFNEYFRNEFTRKRLQAEYNSLVNKMKERFTEFRNRVAEVGQKHYLMPVGLVDVGTYDFSKQRFPIHLGCQKMRPDYNRAYEVLPEDVVRNSYEVTSYETMTAVELAVTNKVYTINIITERCNFFLEMDPETAEEFVDKGRAVYGYLIWKPELVYVMTTYSINEPVALIGRVEGLVLVGQDREILRIYKF